jgi:aryl-alcohol dehydrogenase-like predicted oxidoreductase
MQIRNLGGSGLRVSAVGLGCNNFGQRTDLETSRKVIHKAIDLGITLFDTADIYAGMGGSETVLGQVLGDRRKDIVLATKYSKPMATDGTKQGASRRYIMSAVEASLTRLKTDYIDLYQQHDYDSLTPIEETLRALDDLVRQGKVRYIGNSNFPAWRIAEAELIARQMNVNKFVSCQDEYSLVVREIEKDLLPAAQEYKLGLLPFFPLASGLLTGKYKRGAPAPEDTRFGARLARPLRHAAQRGHRRETAGLRGEARPLHAGTGVLMAGIATASRKRDRRCHPRRTDRAERAGDRLGAQRGRDRGDRQDHKAVMPSCARLAWIDVRNTQ